jgi:hypothetical protein
MSNPLGHAYFPGAAKPLRRHMHPGAADMPRWQVSYPLTSWRGTAMPRRRLWHDSCCANLDGASLVTPGGWHGRRNYRSAARPSMYHSLYSFPPLSVLTRASAVVVSLRLHPFPPRPSLALFLPLWLPSASLSHSVAGPLSVRPLVAVPSAAPRLRPRARCNTLGVTA